IAKEVRYFGHRLGLLPVRPSKSAVSAHHRSDPTDWHRGNIRRAATACVREKLALPGSHRQKLCFLYVYNPEPPVCINVKRAIAEITRHSVSDDSAVGVDPQ